MPQTSGNDGEPYFPTPVAKPSIRRGRADVSPFVGSRRFGFYETGTCAAKRQEKRPNRWISSAPWYWLSSPPSLGHRPGFADRRRGLHRRVRRRVTPMTATCASTALRARLESQRRGCTTCGMLRRLRCCSRVLTFAPPRTCSGTRRQRSRSRPTRTSCRRRNAKPSIVPASDLSGLQQRVLMRHGNRGMTSIKKACKYKDLE